MLIPYRDENPTSRTAVITILLILANIAVFAYQIFGKEGYVNITNQIGLIPSELMTGKNLSTSTWTSPYLTVISYMFLHGGVMHLLFNMLFLWIFGNNVEDRMSPFKFLIFYLITGAVSGVIFAVSTPGMNAPLVGASGAISGILGAYILMFPFAQLRVLFFIFRIKMPAVIFIVIWFVMQIFGVLDTKSGSNVAWSAHISGFAAGVILFKFFTVKRRKINNNAFIP
ncbi:MAG: rhomboid family intramembrane serine protease [Spirochaetes bacterium]|nr:rhomboid family intramembrane serine protease [Spirochaetota bacterium]